MTRMDDGDRRLLAELTAEWANLGRDERERLAGWAARWPALAGCVELPDCLSDGRHRADDRLFALLAEDHAGDPVAGRVVLQALMPSLIRMAGRDAGCGLSDYVAELWCRIRTYPLGRRPARIANNLELDTLKAVLRGRPTGAVPIAAGELEAILTSRRRPEPPSEPDAPAVIGAALRHGLIDRLTGQVMTTVYGEGLSGREAAVRHDTTVDLIRWRCSRGMRTLARYSVLLAEVA